MGRKKGSRNKNTVVRLGRPPIVKRRQRAASPFLKKGLEEINLEIREAYVHITGDDKLWDTYEKIKPPAAEECFSKYKGRCVYCDKRLSYLGRKSTFAARLAFYVPLNVGGEARQDNLVITCAQCKNDYRSTRKFREDIEGVDSFADTCEALFKAIKNDGNVDTIDKLKNRLNIRLSDIANCMRYVVRSDWVPDKMQVIVEGENTIGERLETMAKGEDVTKEITEDIKQIIKTKQYNIIKRPEE